MELWVNELWLLATALIFTVYGYVIGVKSNIHKMSEMVIDKLIKDGYLKTRGTGKNMEILKWHDTDQNK